MKEDKIEIIWTKAEGDRQFAEMSVNGKTINWHGKVDEEIDFVKVDGQYKRVHKGWYYIIGPLMQTGRGEMFDSYKRGIKSTKEEAFEMAESYLRTSYKGRGKFIYRRSINTRKALLKYLSKEWKQLSKIPLESSFGWYQDLYMAMRALAHKGLLEYKKENRVYWVKKI